MIEHLREWDSPEIGHADWRRIVCCDHEMVRFQGSECKLVGFTLQEGLIFQWIFRRHFRSMCPILKTKTKQEVWAQIRREGRGCAHSCRGRLCGAAHKLFLWWSISSWQACEPPRDLNSFPLDSGGTGVSCIYNTPDSTSKLLSCFLQFPLVSVLALT